MPEFPSRAAYVLVIESYEYSRYQLGTVVSRSGIGTHEAIFQPRDVASGLYYYVLNTDGIKQVGKMTLLK